VRTREGVGRVAPGRYRVDLSPLDRTAARDAAARIAEHRGYARRTDQWGQGYWKDPRHPLVIGLVGEHAFRAWAKDVLGVALDVDTTLKPRGDGDVDFDLCGYGVQVKTAAAPYDRLLVRCRHFDAPADGEAFKWDVCVRVQLQPKPEWYCGESAFDQWEWAELCGVVWRCDFHRLSAIVPGRVDGEWNYAIDPDKFLPLATLTDKCLARMMRSDRDAG